MTTKRRPLRRKKGKLQIKIKSWEFQALAPKWRFFQFKKQHFVTMTPSGQFLVLKIYSVGKTLNKILSVAKRNLPRARRRPRRRRTRWAWRTARSGTTTPRSPSVRGEKCGGLEAAAGINCLLSGWPVFSPPSRAAWEVGGRSTAREGRAR